MDSAVIMTLVKALQVFLGLLAELDLTRLLWPPERDVPNGACFDYIIIGAGTAGCVLGNRLSENPNITVLMVEAGRDPQLQDLIPSLFFTEPNSDSDWAYTGTFDPYAAKAQNGFTKLQAGKLLGGSSSMNHFIHQRGAPADFDNWAKILRDETWSYENLLPYFKKSEALKDPEILASKYRKYHGLNGPIGIARQPQKSAKVYLDSFNETGSPIQLDLNGKDTIGYTQSLLVVFESIRQGTAYAYLRPIRDRPNLYVLRHTLATRIIFEGKRAVAVEVVRDGKTNVYKACKEVILSAGVYNSAQILMLSGIGHQEHLQSFNIEVISDQAVGDNFQDQMAVSLVYKTARSLEIPFVPLTGVPFPIILGLAALNPRQNFADYQVFALVYGHDLPFILLTCAIIFPYRNDICDSFNAQSIGRNTLYSLLTDTKPKSRGTIRLASTNPYDKPIINTGYLTNETDLVNMREYIKDFIKVGNASYFRDVGAELIDPGLEECKKYTYSTDGYWDCYVRNTLVSVYHTSSTCAMGIVLDSKFRVKGVTNLRVVDASAMPHLISGSPNAVVVMMAEKAADLIKDDAKQYPCNETCGVNISKDGESSGLLDKVLDIF